MKIIFIRLGTLLILLTFLNNCQNNNMKTVDSKIDEVKNKFAPDKRVAVFDIRYKNKEGKIFLSGESDNPNAVDELIMHFEKQKIQFENNIKTLPDTDLGEKKYGIVNLSVANIRSNPKHPAELATQSLLGTAVNVLKEEDGWYLIQTPDKYISWVDDDGIFLVDEVELNKWKKSKKIIVAEHNAVAYQKPDQNSDKVSDLVMGDILKFVGHENKFTKVEFPDAREAYVISDFTHSYETWSSDSVSSEQTILNTAKGFVGLPYLWGGTSIKGVDCSGFTKTVYYMNGVILPRDASQQVHVGELIDTEDRFANLLRGDLLFFGRKKTESEKEKITHVAIYVGDKKYIHSSGRVRYNSLNKDDEDFNQHRYDTFIRAKRIIGKYDNGENLVKNNPFYN